MVRAGQPQGGVALHAVVTNGRVLQKAVHGMAHMQLAGDVGRRHDDGKGLFALHAVRHERAAVLPHFVELILDLLRIVHLFHGEFLILSHFLSSFPIGCAARALVWFPLLPNRACSGCRGLLFSCFLFFPLFFRTVVRTAPADSQREPFNGKSRPVLSKGRSGSVVPPYFAVFLLQQKNRLCAL